MATQTVEFPSSTGRTLTAKLFAVGSDTQTASQSATEATNRKGVYSAAFTDVAAGDYHLVVLDGSSVPSFVGFVTLTLTTATFQSRDTQGDNVGLLGASAQSATDLKDFADTGYDPATHKVQGVVLTDTVTTLTGHTAQTGDSFALLTGTGAVTFASLTVSGATTFTGAVTATNASNDFRGVSMTAAGYAAVFTTQMTESYAADGTAPTPAQSLFLIQQYLTDFIISSTSYTIRKLDGSTTAAVITLNDATNPTGATRSS